MTSKLTLLASALLTLIATACNNTGSRPASHTQTDTDRALSVNQVLENPDDYIGHTVTLEGVCSHLCKHGGRKAFIAGDSDNILLRCEAFPGMDAPFSAETIHKPIRVTGVFCEERINEEYLRELERMEQERAYAINSEGGEVVPGEQQSGCDTERAARGQQALNTLNERIADYRARIAERQQLEGKDYLSFYYLEATSYEILPD